MVFGDSAVCLDCCWAPVFLISGLAAPILALGGVVSVVFSKGQLVGVKWAVLAILVWVGWIWVIAYSFDRSHAEAHKVVCGANMFGLGKAITIYASNHNGKYPTPDKWCDLLVEGDYASKKMFICRAAPSQDDKDKCHYAINPNCEPNSPPDMVLLFETKGGWNQLDGPEILTTENHKGQGCNVLFNDGSVKFVEPQELGKLKWKVEELNTTE
jgi:prepilin-type processing-associated H-X9-DG protein